MAASDADATSVTTGDAAANHTMSEPPLPPQDVLRQQMMAYQAGSLEAFHAVYSALSPPLLRYLRYLTRRADIAEDLLQETFLQMHRSRAGYDPAYPVSPWAFGLARNVYLMNRRATARFAAVHDDSADVPDVVVPADMEHLATRDLVRRALARLEREQAEPLLLHHVWGFSFDEIAGMLGISSGAARARSSRAMTALRAHLASEQESV